MVLGSLRHQVVVHAVFAVQKEGRGGLEAAAQRNQQACRDVPLREASLLRLRAIDGDVKPRIIEGLLDAQVRETRHVPELGQNLVRHLAVLFEIGTFYLNVDGRRQSEVQNLRDHIRRQEIEGRFRELCGQSGSQCGNVVRRRMMFLLQSDQNVRVSRSQT